jgi:DNA polymerase I-like protein with 3'-5' exonuclease and polymerase domains
MIKVVVFKAEDSWHYIQLTTKEYKTGTIQEICSHIKKDDLVFLLQVSDFIREFDNEYPQNKLPSIVDIESFVKQFCQKSKPLETQKKWNFFKFLKENEYLSKEFRIQESIETYLSFIVDFVMDIFYKKCAEEVSRFENIEIPINALIYQRQRKGINIDQTIYPDLIQIIEEELYNIKNQLQLEHKVYSPDDISTQIKILENEGMEIKGSLLTLFKSSKSSSEICKLIYQMLRAENDLRALIYLTSNKGGESRTFPNYHGFGSISSRITLREPALQNLRKKTRIILKPDDNCEFIYVDYSQFEAGILAYLSQDDKLMKLYDTDIYEDVNLKVWNGEKDRDEAKILFYKYMYGMALRLISESKYFNSFTKLTKFKKQIEEEIESTGKVGSSNGNFRVLEIEDKTIALSHRIQSEASLIFKEALLKVSKEISEADFILPMHDAALYQVNIVRYNKNDVVEKIKKVFKDAFALKCPGINHSVKIKDFYVD